MQNVLVPFDGSDNALRAVRYAATAVMNNPLWKLELLHVLDPMTLKAYVHMPPEEISRMHAEAADRMLQPAKQLLNQAGIPYQTSYRIGDAACEIAARVRESGSDGIIMGTRGMSPMANLIIGSVATRTVHLVDVPVTLVK